MVTASTTTEPVATVLAEVTPGTTAGVTTNNAPGPSVAPGTSLPAPVGATGGQGLRNPARSNGTPPPKTAPFDEIDGDGDGRIESEEADRASGFVPDFEKTDSDDSGSVNAKEYERELRVDPP